MSGGVQLFQCTRIMTTSKTGNNYRGFKLYFHTMRIWDRVLEMRVDI